MAPLRSKGVASPSLFGTIVAMQYLPALLYTLRHKDLDRAKQLLAGGVASFVLLLPAIPQLRTLITHWKLLSYSEAPTMRDLVDVLNPDVIALPVRFGEFLFIAANPMRTPMKEFGPQGLRRTA